MLGTVNLNVWNFDIRPPIIKVKENATHSNILHKFRIFYVSHFTYSASMITTTTTPYKLAEIIRLTWPNFYKPSKLEYNDRNAKELNDTRNLRE